MTQKLATHPAPVTLTQTVAAADSTIDSTELLTGVLNENAIHSD